MRRYSVPGLITVAVFAAYWAYTIIDSLIREFSANVTFVDLGVLFVLGLVAGLALGAAFALSTRPGADAR